MLNVIHDEYFTRNKRSSFTAIIQRPSIKKPNFFKIYFFAYNSVKLVSFKILPSPLDTPHPTFIPVRECVPERVLRNGTKVPYRIYVCDIQGDSFGTRPKKMRISQRLFIRF